MKKLVLPISLTAIIALTGCGGGGPNGNTSGKQVKVKASDAYVVKLETNATAEYNGHVYTSVTVGTKGEVVFNVPKDFNESMADYKIPADAWVDVDMDGKWDSKKDCHMRMALRAEGNFVANPIGTVILEQEKPDMELYKQFKNFDPVEAKKDIIKDPTNHRLLAKIIVSDSIAFAIKEAKDNHKNVHDFCKTIKVDVLENIDANSNDMVVLVSNLLANTDINKDKIIDIAQNELKAIYNAHKKYKNGEKEKALKDLIKFTDGYVN